MEFNFSNDKAIWLQLSEILKQEILSGRLQPGDKVPSVRELAMQAKVNPNTVQKAYSMLEQEGFVYTRRGSGKFVRPAQDHLNALRMEEARKKAVEFLKEMRRLGISNEQWMRLLEEEENGNT